jgi:hypothetical protein
MVVNLTFEKRHPHVSYLLLRDDLVSSMTDCPNTDLAI